MMLLLYKFVKLKKNCPFLNRILCSCDTYFVVVVIMIITFNRAVTETASENFGKHHQRKKPWITAEILDLCDKRRELRKKRFEPGGSEKYREVNDSIKKCMKKGEKLGRTTM